MALHPKFQPPKIYPFVNRINKAMTDVCQDGEMDCRIQFCYMSEENEEVVVHRINIAIAKSNPLKSGVITDALNSIANCGIIKVEIEAQGGYIKTFDLKSGILPNGNPLTQNTQQPSSSLAGGLGGMSGMLGALEGLEGNKTGLGYIIAKSESASQIEQIRRDCDRQIVEIEKEAEKDKQYLSNQLTEKKYSFLTLEREKKEKEEEIKRLIQLLDSEKDERKKLEEKKKDFDTSKIMSDMGLKLAGFYLLNSNRGKTDDLSETFNQAALGLIAGAELKALSEIQQQENKPTAPSYTPEKQKRIAMLSSIGLFDSVDEASFGVFYELLKMICANPNMYNDDIYPIMQRYHQNPTHSNPTHSNETHED